LIDAKTSGNNKNAKWSELEKVEIMTTRPELLPACVALMCHPDDAEKYEGKHAVTPLFNVIVPIVADEKVDKEKGTGLVMCCTFGDETDIEWWQIHKLDTRVILNKFGKIDRFEALNFYSKETCLDFAALKKAFQKIENKKVSNPNKDKEGKVLGARETVIQMLEDQNELNSQKKITHSVKCAERSGASLEFIPTYQWFIKILDKKDQLKDKAAECNWYPQYMKVRIDQWIDGLSWDWCISRQRYFGVLFPIWYSKRAGEEGKILIAEPSQLPVNPLVDLPEGYTKNEVIPETDVMDTWATSSVSPQLNSKAINEDYAVDYDRHQKLFPADLRPQAHEIIRTWAFYTIAKSHLHEDTIPWKNLMISGWCLAEDKTKMSKSKGNVVTPVGLIEQKGSDVVRYWASTSHLGTDTAYSEDVLKIGKKLTNKLWNATKFASIQLTKLEQKPSSMIEDVKEGFITETIDLWIISRLANAIDKSTEAFKRYEYCRAREAIEDFFWNDFCDNYLEIVKVRSYGENDKFTEQQQQSALHTLYHCVENILKLFAPFVPHITEELYSHIFDDIFEANGSIHKKGNWPKRLDCFYDENAEQAGIACVDILNAVRKLKADKNVSIKWPLDNLYISRGSGHYEGWEQLDSIIDDLASVTNTKNVSWQEQLPMDVDSCSTVNDVFQVAVQFAEESDAA
ncbi:MAG: class I tRNA ligase family protein, partial [Rickettsiales bacterium]|nr:class I tRNA ligase family protein [Rickettsiales bacterium]